MHSRCKPDRTAVSGGTCASRVREAKNGTVRCVFGSPQPATVGLDNRAGNGQANSKAILLGGKA